MTHKVTFYNLLTWLLYFIKHILNSAEQPWELESLRKDCMTLASDLRAPPPPPTISKVESLDRLSVPGHVEI